MARRPPAVARVLERVTATARAHEMFLPGQSILVAVSGGPDSVCLLYSLHHLRRLFKLRLEVFHLDHRLRSGSASETAYVRQLAARLGVPFHLQVAGSTPSKGESVEAWARMERIRHASELCRETGAERIAEGHTLDDQAETVLIALIRGGGLEALAAIEPVLGREVQPLIDVTRSEVEAFCRALHLRPRRDPTNLDTRLLRNAVRLEVIPAIERAVGRDVRATLARTSGVLRRDERELRLQASAAAETLVEETPSGLDIDANGLLGQPNAIASRVVRTAIYRMGVVPTEEAITSILDLAAGRPGRRRDLPDGLKVVRNKEYLSLSRSSPESRERGGRDGRPGRPVRTE
jgi:tRNA(Ile)-lysidine synthase